VDIHRTRKHKNTHVNVHNTDFRKFLRTRPMHYKDKPYHANVYSGLCIQSVGVFYILLARPMFANGLFEAAFIVLSIVNPKSLSPPPPLPSPPSAYPTLISPLTLPPRRVPMAPLSEGRSQNGDLRAHRWVGCDNVHTIPCRKTHQTL